MSIEGLVVALVLTLSTAFLVIMPLLRRETGLSADAALAQKQRERLLVYYERVLTNIRDLDEDQSTGKIPLADYEEEREIWTQRGIQVLKALDSLDGVQSDQVLAPTQAEDTAIDRAIDDAVEAAIAAYRQKR